jgi:hypothetical protein
LSKIKHWSKCGDFWGKYCEIYSNNNKKKNLENLVNSLKIGSFATEYFLFNFLSQMFLGNFSTKEIASVNG